jgi:hypothetical protein
MDCLGIKAADNAIAIEDAIFVLAPDVRIPSGDQGLHLGLA